MENTYKNNLLSEIIEVYHILDSLEHGPLEAKKEFEKKLFNLRQEYHYLNFDLTD